MCFVPSTQKLSETYKKRYSCLVNLFWHWAGQEKNSGWQDGFMGFTTKNNENALKTLKIHSFIEGMCRKGFPGKLMLQQRTHRTLGEWRTIVLQPLVWGANRPGSSPLKNFKLPKSSKPQIRPKLFHLLLKTPFEGLRKSSTVLQIAIWGIAAWC